MENSKDAIDRETVALRRQRDFDDLQNEFAGAQTGRAARFLTSEAANPKTEEKRKTERAEMLTRLQLLMQDPAYAALYNDTMDQLGEAERATEAALNKALERQEAADAALADIRARALKLEDGQNAYRDDDGTLRTEDGSAVSDSEADAIAEQWRPGMPGYRDYTENREAAQAEADTVDAIRRYQTDTIGSARDRLLNDDDPPSIDDLQRITKGIRDGMPPAVQAEMSSDAAPGITTRTNSAPLKLAP